MTAIEFKKIILFFANRWKKEIAIEIYGETLGNHFWNKWADYCESYNADYASMQLFYDMTNLNIQRAIDYINKNYK